MEHSIAVLSQNLKLLLFPIISFVATVAIFLFFLGAFFFQPSGHSYSDKAHWKAVASSVFTQDSIADVSQPHQEGEKPQLVLNKAGAGIAVAVYFFAMFLATFFNVAFYHEIMEAFNGRPVSLRQGFGFALSKIKPILFWSLLAGAVGYLIKQLEQRLGFVGKIVVNLIGLAWSVAAIFAIPVIVCEEITSNPLQVLKSSASSLKKTWGETLAGFAGIQLGVLLLLMTTMIPFGGLVFLGASINNGTLVVLALTTWAIFVVLFSYFASVASNVFHCALYVFASTGAVPAGFTREMMDLAWKHKKS